MSTKSLLMVKIQILSFYRLKEGILKIRISGGSLLTPGRTKIKLYHSRPLDQIHVYQESQLTASTPLEQTSLLSGSKDQRCY
jgi:hypothetical protein